MSNGDGDSWFKYDKRLRPEILKGKRWTVTIRGFGEAKREDYGKEKIVPVLYLEKTDKYLELNDSNRMTLVHLFGDQKSACVGKQIDLIVEPVRGGKIGVVIYPASVKAPAPTVAESGPITSGGNGKPIAEPASNPFLDAASKLRLTPSAIEGLLKQAGGDPSKAFDLLTSKFQAPT